MSEFSLMTADQIREATEAHHKIPETKRDKAWKDRDQTIAFYLELAVCAEEGTPAELVELPEETEATTDEETPMPKPVSLDELVERFHEATEALIAVKDDPEKWKAARVKCWNLRSRIMAKAVEEGVRAPNLPTIPQNPNRARHVDGTTLDKIEREEKKAQDGKKERKAPGRRAAGEIEVKGSLASPRLQTLPAAPAAKPAAEPKATPTPHPEASGLEQATGPTAAMRSYRHALLGSLPALELLDKADAEAFQKELDLLNRSLAFAGDLVQRTGKVA